MKSIDLNLFRVFDAVIRHRNAGAAARELGVTASAVSHGLGRLRRLLGDELFVPAPSGLAPTARALELAAEIGGGVARLQNIVRDRPFVPAQAQRHFTIAASDYLSRIFLGGLMARIQAEAPGITVTIFPASRNEVGRFMEARGVDLLLSWVQAVPPHLCRRAVGYDRETVLARAGHPLATGIPDRGRLLAFPHVVVELTGTAEHGDGAFLDDRGIERRIWNERLLIDEQGRIGRVALTIPTYGPLPDVLGRTDMIATAPLSIAAPMIADGVLVALPLPYEPLVFPIEAVWHQRDDADPALRWLVDRVAGVAAARLEARG